MPATLVQIANGVSLGNPITAYLSSPSGSGNLLVLMIGRSWYGAQFPPSFTDGLGNTWNCASSVGASLAIYYVNSCAPGTIGASVDVNSSNWFSYIIAEFSGGYSFSDSSTCIGRYNPSWVTDHNTSENWGSLTGTVGTADTLYLTCFVWNSHSDGPIPNIVSEEGDAVYATPTYQGASLAMLRRDVYAGGQAMSRIYVSNDPFYGYSYACTAAFSKPIPRPAGTISQFGLRTGFGDPIHQWPENPIRATFPYVPVIGGTIFVIASVADFTGTFQVSDAYGNVYNQIASLDTSDGLRVYSSTVSALPPPGEVFQVSLLANGGNPLPLAAGQRQLVLAIAEYDVGPGSVAVAGIKSVTITNPATYTSYPLNVQPGSFMLALTIPIFGSTGSSDYSYTPLEDYVLRGGWGYSQCQGQQTNAPRIAVAALMDKFVSAGGSYDAQLQTYDPWGNTGSNGSGMALIAFVSGQPILACPLNNFVIPGVPYSGAMISGGGTPPYTFALTGGALPPGLSLDPATGVISGTTSFDGSFSYTVTMTDANGNTASATCALVVAPPYCAPFAINTPTPVTSVYPEPLERKGT
jgi:hypothetical protein